MENFQELLMERFHIFTMATFLFLLMLLVTWSYGYFTFPRHDQGPNENLSNKVILVSFGIFLILQVLFIPLSFEFWFYFYTLGEGDIKRYLTPELKGWANIYGILMCGLGMFFYFSALPSALKKIILGSYALKGWKAKYQDFTIASMSWILSYPLVIAVGQVVALFLMFTYKNVEPEQVAVQQIKTATTSTSLLVVLIFCIILIVPMIEELLFRGFLQNWIKKFMDPWKAIAVTSLIFALFHFSPTQGMGNIELIISLFILSCFLGFIYERQKSLWAPFFLHSIFNTVSIMLILYLELK